MEYYPTRHMAGPGNTPKRFATPVRPNPSLNADALGGALRRRLCLWVAIALYAVVRYNVSGRRS
jgi:hypothetical protein